jgi:hypothetical protein
LSEARSPNFSPTFDFYLPGISIVAWQSLADLKQIEIEKLYGDIGKDSDVLNEENRISKMNDDLKKQEIFIADDQKL